MIPLGASLRGYDAKAVSLEESVRTGSESLVQQHFREEADINTIVRRFGMTGQMPSGVAGGVYGDFTGIEDYASAVERIERARDGFMTLPPEVRERFGNDPGRLVDLAQSLTEDEFGELVAPVPAPVVPVAPVAAPGAGDGAPAVPAPVAPAG